jgi:nucleoside-diphosphate-sugar epimerase
MSARVLVTGAGGFLGHHLVASLVSRGYWVRGADLRHPAFEPSRAHEFLILDLREAEACRRACEGVDEVYALAADMGGMGFLATHRADVLHGNALIDLNTIEAARRNGCRRYLITSSACVYPGSLQRATDAAPLREEDAHPADPPDAYGWEKLLAERLCIAYQEDYGFEARIARLHNVYGPLGTWRGGREKAPAALCRKVAQAKLAGRAEIEIWGDGRQTRSFCYVDDAVEGLQRLLRSDWRAPLNLGQNRAVSVDELCWMIAKIAGVDLELRHVEGPEGVRGRNSDNARLRSVLGWEPATALEEGLSRTYAWIEQQVTRSAA